MLDSIELRFLQFFPGVVVVLSVEVASPLQLPLLEGLLFVVLVLHRDHLQVLQLQTVLLGPVAPPLRLALPLPLRNGGLPA